MTTENAPSTQTPAITSTEQAAAGNNTPAAEPTLAEALKAEFAKAEEADKPAAKTKAPATEKSAKEPEQPEAGEDDSEESTSDEEEKVNIEESETEEDKLEKEVEKEFPLIPKDWSQDEKDAFQALLDSGDENQKAAAEIFIERYNLLKKGFYNKTREYSDKKKEFAAVDEIFKPIDGKMKELNLSKPAYIQDLVNWDKLINTNPVEGIKKLIDRAGLKPEQIFPKSANLDNIDWDEDFTEDEKSANNQVTELQKTVQKLENQLANLPIETQIRQFQEAKDSEGKLLHPHFKTASPIMGGLMQSNPKLTMEQAYKKALTTLDVEDDVADTPENTLKATNELREKVAKARRAAKGSKPSNGKPDTANMSLAEELGARIRGQL